MTESERFLGFQRKDGKYQDSVAYVQFPYFEIESRKLVDCISIVEHKAFKAKVRKAVDEIKEWVEMVAENKDLYLKKKLNPADMESFFVSINSLKDLVFDKEKELGLSEKKVVSKRQPKDNAKALSNGSD